MGAKIECCYDLRFRILRIGLNMSHVFMRNLKYRFKVLEMSCCVICSLLEKEDDRIFMIKK